MTVFWLVRHGAYPLLDHALGGRGDHALNEAGRAQAARAGAVLGEQAIAAIISSPVERARETAAAIAQCLALTVRIEPGFAEIDFAGWTGQTFAALGAQAAWRRWNSFRSIAGAPGGETMLAAQARAVGAIVRLAEAYPLVDLVVVSHGDIIKAILAQLLGSPLDLLRRLDIAPGSISRISLGQDDAHVLGVNLVP